MLFFPNFEKNDVMEDKKKNKVEEPAEVYHATPKTDSLSVERDRIIFQLLEEAKKDVMDGKVYFHDEVMTRLKARFPFLK